MSGQCSPVHWESDEEPVVVTKEDEALLRAQLLSLCDDEEQPARQRGRKKMYQSKDENKKAAAKLEAMRQERLRREVPVAPRTQRELRLLNWANEFKEKPPDKKKKKKGSKDDDEVEEEEEEEKDDDDDDDDEVEIQDAVGRSRSLPWTVLQSRQAVDTMIMEYNETYTMNVCLRRSGPGGRAAPVPRRSPKRRAKSTYKRD